MRVLLTGGGTAGHINPLLAIADTVKWNVPNAEIAFVGVKGGREEDLVPREGYPLYYVDSVGYSRPILSPKNIRAAWLTLTSPYSKKTCSILKEFRPDIVIGTGGYVCQPILSAAARMGIPCALHESNALPGRAVKLLQSKVDRVWINFEQSREHLKKKTEILTVGNPLRADYRAVNKQEARKKLGIPDDRFFILCFGGSVGAEAVNAAMLSVMQRVCARHPDVLLLHATGKQKYQDMAERVKALGLQNLDNCTVKEYIYDMPQQMAAADLVISRAGAMTLSELAQLKKPCVLIPSPHVTDNHQYVNAKVLTDAGAALLVEEENLPAGALEDAVLELYRNRSALVQMEERIATFAGADANQKIWNDILTLIK
ncbi:MAG: undecaprenyldiphospho-muramoylpentapeptide beta-N-acetylglucosaminyltransferase [Clostridia bacterium]|nr:undecaprenyldiphospho-muramoylpentapeptide beta-N-acetylglucosaminyltransferase [Clostridia bacterium]